MEILETLSFLHVLMQIGNLSQWYLDRKTWTFHRSRILEIYTLLVLIASIVFFFYELFNDSGDRSQLNEPNDIGRTVDFIQGFGIRFAHIISMVEGVWRRNDSKKFFEQVQEIDRIFERSLNVIIDNKKLRAHIIRTSIMVLIIYLGAVAVILYMQWLTAERPQSLFWYLYLLPFIICSMRYIQIIVAILIIKRRFDKLVQILGEIDLMNHNKKNNETMTTTTAIKLFSYAMPTATTTMESQMERITNRRLDMENPELKRLLIIRDIYNRLWELSANVNRCFGLSMLVNVGNDFVTITSSCYWIFLTFQSYSREPTKFLHLIIGSALWSIPHFLNVLTLAIICEPTVQSTTNVALCLHRVAIDIFNDNHNTVIEQFSLQLLHQKMAFSAAGFFTINCTLLYTIAGATTTYLIILIQFHMNEQKTTKTG